MQKIIINEISYELIENYRDCFELELVTSKMTDYFDGYDYILGDFAYGKLRLKGFCERTNPNCNTINCIENKEQYIKTECAYNCRYFLLKKIK